MAARTREKLVTTPPHTARAPRLRSSRGAGALIKHEANDLVADLDGHTVHLTNLQKVFWPSTGTTKGDLIRFYLEVSPWLLPHLRERAMVMKRYPHGVSGPFFFMKRTPAGHPPWLKTCSIPHASGNVIDFPIIDDLGSLAWVINLGCIDLNQWYARCDDVQRPDYMHFDLDPGQASFEQVCEVALVLHETLEGIGMPHYVKTSGSKGLHVYVPIVRGPVQKQVWTVAKAIALDVAGRHPSLATGEYRVAKRPAQRVLIDYNQNAWGRTLASVYSVRPREQPCVSTPISWQELADGVRIEDFQLHDVPARLRAKGDLFAPVLHGAKGRFELRNAS